MPKVKRSRRIALLLIVLSSGISILWGSIIARNSPGGLTDFIAVYYGARCLIQHTDPYQPADFLHAYQAGGRIVPAEPMMSDLFRRAVLVCVNLPTTLFFLIPFALLPLLPAYMVWAALMAVGLIASAFLMWDAAAGASPRLALFLVCFVVANCVILFADGNTACIVISLCVVAVWCFLRDRFVSAGVVCLAICLAIKPHDAGLVWLYFLLAGGVYRKRALQTLLVTVVLCLPVVLWVSHAVPNWLPELRLNLQASSARGGLNDPGPAAIGFHHPDPIIDLQAAVSVLRDEPRIYVPACYVVSGTLLVIWAWTTVRSPFSQDRAWLALAAISALTMLVGYHRQHDAKLLLLTIPACAMLWAERGAVGWFALLVNSAALFITADIPATELGILAEKVSLGPGFLGHLKAAMLVRPAPTILLVMAIFYLCVYMHRAGDFRANLAC
jgi:hypothetical protein